MTIEETVTIMAMLGAFYSGGKNDPKMQAKAWHIILQKYKYETAQQAVLNFAENDTREYATFPTVGVIVKEIRKQRMLEEKPVKDVIYGVIMGKKYENLDAEAKKIISETKYEDWLSLNSEYFVSKADEFADQLITGHTLMIE